MKIIIDEDKIGSIIYKSGFKNDIGSKFEVIGILHKVVSDEQAKLDDKLKVQTNYTIKEPFENEDAI